MLFPDKNHGFQVKLSYSFKNIFTNDIEKILIQKLNQVPNNQTVTLASPYFLPTVKLQKTIIDSANNKGIKYIILSNSTKSLFQNFSIMASISHQRMRNIYKHTPENSVKFYEYIGNPDIGVKNMHQKIWLFGKSKTAEFAIGSSNLDSQSLRINSEDMLWIQSPQLKQKINKMIKNDLSNKTSSYISKKTLNEETWFLKFKTFLIDFFFNPIL